jgi:hypothetical protein
VRKRGEAIDAEWGAYLDVAVFCLACRRLTLIERTPKSP